MTSPGHVAEVTTDADTGRLRFVSSAIALIVVYLGLQVLSGWLLDIPILRAIHPEWPPMVPNTALGMLLAGVGLFLAGGGPRAVLASRACAAVLLLAGLLIISEYRLGFDTGQRYWLFADLLLQHSVDRVAEGTAISFMLVAVLLLVQGSRRWRRGSEALLHLLGVLALLRFLGYPFGVDAFESLGGYKTMALLTSFCFVLLWLGLAALRGRQGLLGILLSPHSGGLVARILLPTALLLPFLAGWLRLRWQEAGLFSLHEGVLLFSISTAVVTAGVSFWVARLLNRADEQRREQELALAMSEARLRRLFESPMLGVFYWNLKGDILDANERFLSMIRQERELLLAGQLSWAALTPPDYNELELEKIRELVQTGSVTPYEKEFISADGSRVPVVVGAAMLDHEAYEGVAFVIDNSERQQHLELIKQRNSELAIANTEINKAAAQLRAVLDAAQDAVVSINREGLIIEWNRASEALLGWTADEAIGQPVTIIIPPQYRSDHLSGLANYFRSGEGPVIGRLIEIEALHRSGMLIPIELSVGQPVGSGEAVTFTAFISDITERRAAQETITQRNVELEMLNSELSRSQAHLQMLFDSPMLGILHWSADGRILSANDRLLQMLGGTRADFAAGRIGWEHIAPPEFAELDKANLALLSTVGSIEPYEKEFIRLDGSRIPVLVGAATLDIEHGEGVAYALDASEVRRQREEIELRNSELQRINAELDSFSYSVSHDLRAPLRAVEGFSKALEEDYAAQLDEDAQRYLGRIRSGTLRMAQLIDDLLQLSRVGRADLNVQLVDLSELATAVLRGLSDSQPQRRVEWTIQPGLLVQADARLLRIVLDNLLGNAWKFSSERAEARIEVGRVVTERGMAFFVRDNGAGFDMAYAAKLFTAFQRLHRVEQFPGTGIGLSIVRRIVNRHGGDIWAESEPERGATFYFTLRSGERHG